MRTFGKAHITHYPRCPNSAVPPLKYPDAPSDIIYLRGRYLTRPSPSVPKNPYSPRPKVEPHEPHPSIHAPTPNPIPIKNTTPDTGPAKRHNSLTQLVHHPPDPLPLHLRPVILPEEAHIAQIPLRQHDHDGVELPRPVVVVAVLAPRAGDEGVVAVRLGEAQRLRHVRHGAGAEQELEQTRPAAQDRGLDGVGVG